MALRELLLPWDAQPQEVCNPGGPLARGVVMLAMPTRPDRDLLGISSLTPSSAPVVTGPGGRAWQFSGGSGSVLVPHRADLNLTTEFTIFALVRSTDATGAQYILNKNYNGSTSVPMSLAIGGTPAQEGLSFYQGISWRASGIGGVDIRGDNRVHAVAGTFASNQDLAYWVDGVQRSAANFAVSPIATTTDVYIGRYKNDSASFRGDIYLVGISSRAWSAGEHAAFAENPWQLFEPRRIFVPVSAGGGDNVTVNLSGISASFAQTAPAVSSTAPLVGESVTASAGTLLPAFSFSLLGQAGAASAGTLSPSTSRTLSGQSAAFSAGSVIPSVAIAAIGLQATFTAGTLTASSSAGSTVALTGESATFAPTAPSTSVTIALTGIAATMAAGILSSSSGTATITVKAGSWLRYKKLQ